MAQGSINYVVLIVKARLILCVTPPIKCKWSSDDCKYACLLNTSSIQHYQSFSTPSDPTQVSFAILWALQWEWIRHALDRNAINLTFLYSLYFNNAG